MIILPSFSKPSIREVSRGQLVQDGLNLAIIREFIKYHRILVHDGLDEFQEIVTVKEAQLNYETILQPQTSYSGRGSDFGYNERQRPVFQSAINYPLKLLRRAPI